MSTISPRSTWDDDQENNPEKRRSAFRTRLIEAERGFSVGFRTGSALYVHLFIGLVIVIIGLTFGLRIWGWAALVVAMACGMAGELFHHAVCTLTKNMENEDAVKAEKLSAAGMVMLLFASAVVIAFVLGSRLMLVLN